ncbi:MAG: zinc-binding dehydrogenase [Candidatus Entotheonella factor]|uniref:Zinc-binding dehydrogenase n=1 Tax=Entotheonella factor TaxID=1429438 RepID=W4LDR6_ENTF1|nr:zinc-binding dehydrogenase [Candidatus Entotheonella palauensis]ETW95825.1 MAG: zinc-binding dehydrogenase [Candidatus Entotheonella factor]
MKAVAIYAHGGMEELVYDTDFPEPEIGPNEVLIDIKATSLNYHDVFTRRGMPGIKIPMPMIMGLDIAGEIAQLGPGVDGWSVGERVLIDPIDRVAGGLMGETIPGGLAERCRAAVHQLIRIPDGVSFADAASLPVAYGTAHRMMLTQGQVQAGERVLILGASGGVGTCCVFLAKMAGAEVVACASSEAKLDRLRQFGADHLINYTTHEFHHEVFRLFGKPHRRGGGGVDMVINYTGGDTWVPSLRSLRKGGRMLTCGATAGYDPPTDIRYIWTFELQLLGSNGWTVDDLERLLNMVQTGKLKPVIDRVLPLTEAAEALRLLEEREVIGKVIVEP